MPFNYARMQHQIGRQQHEIGRQQHEMPNFGLTPAGVDDIRRDARGRQTVETRCANDWVDLSVPRVSACRPRLAATDLRPPPICARNRSAPGIDLFSATDLYPESSWKDVLSTEQMLQIMSEIQFRDLDT